MYYGPGDLGPDGEFQFILNNLSFLKPGGPSVPPFFTVTVATPIGEMLNVTILPDKATSDCYTCSFSVTDVGVHSIRINLDPGQNYKLSRNPTLVLMSKREEVVNGQNITQFSASAFDPDRDVKTFECRAQALRGRSIKPWGLATHPVTQVVSVWI